MELSAVFAWIDSEIAKAIVSGLNDCRLPTFDYYAIICANENDGEWPVIHCTRVESNRNEIRNKSEVKLF